MKKKQLIGILNCTPDSYYAAGRFLDPESAIDYGLKLFDEGADIVDIGGESTRPGSAMVSVEEEIKRVIPVIRGIRRQTAGLLSIDTYKPQVAKAAIDVGVNWINDITALSHPQMCALVRESKVQCCIMHAYGEPHTQPSCVYPAGLITEILQFFHKKIAHLLQEGIAHSQLILDPGIGGGAFGKTPDENLKIIKNLKRFTMFEAPILIGLSRKSFLQKILRKSSTDVLSTTLALNTMALLEGATYIRVHDVGAHRDILTILDRMGHNHHS